MKVFCVGDTHFPFHSRSALKKVIAAIKREQPDVVIQMGDLLDQYVMSAYSKSASVSVRDDVLKGLKVARRFWQDVQAAAPKAKCMQLLGNHDARLTKRIADKLPELLEVLNTDLYKFEGVQVAASARNHFKLDGVIYTHGYLSKSIDHAKHFGCPVVHGHTHRPGIVTEGRLWSMDVGHLANEASLPLQYTQTKSSKWRMAYALVVDGLPQLYILK